MLLLIFLLLLVFASERMASVVLFRFLLFSHLANKVFLFFSVDQCEQISSVSGNVLAFFL